MLRDPAYSSLRQLWEVCKGSEYKKSKCTAKTMRAIETIGPFEIASMVLKDVTRDESGDSAERVLKAAHEKRSSLERQRRDFVLDVWGNENFGIGKELLDMLHGVCDGLPPDVLKERPFVKYADFLPEAFAAQVMAPFAQEVLAPVMELAQTTL